MIHGGAPGWLALSALLFVANLRLHLPASDLCDLLARRVGFTTYDAAVRWIFTGLGVLVLGAGWVRARRHGMRVQAALAGLALFAVVAQRLIVVNGIESIHYPQYALVAVLLARGGLAPEGAWIGASALGAADEWYQHRFLPRGTPPYLDWNDIVLNAAGAALGVLGLRLFARRPRPPGPLLPGVAVALGLALTLIVTGILGAPVTSPFFSVTPGGRRFHLLSAMEAVAVLGLLWLGVRALVLAPAASGTIPPARAPGADAGAASNAR